MLCLLVSVTVTVNAKTTNGNNVIAITPKRNTNIIKINERKTRINICHLWTLLFTWNTEARA